MLVLRRQVGESFRLGDEVEVRVLGVSKAGVKVGIIAPKELAIRRTELADLNRRAAKNWTPPDLEELAARLKSR